MPANAIAMINFIKGVRKSHPYSKEDLLMVHCSAGVGRTGTFITLDYMLERIRAEKTINIYEFVCNLRKQRVLMVQTMVRVPVLCRLDVVSPVGVWPHKYLTPCLHQAGWSNHLVVSIYVYDLNTRMVLTPIRPFVHKHTLCVENYQQVA